MRSAVRPEIQALRAIAVLAVVLYHLWPERLPGGYVGVDIFFVISGFLIVGHLVRDASEGGISLLRFWARRVRRLLPASLLVIVITGIATFIWVPDVVWRQWFQELGASAIYLQNWLLAANSVDYLGADNAASPAQHYWSLSVEEQFYIAWPLIIVAVLAIVKVNRRRALFVTLSVITLASFVYSIYAVATDPSPAYFSTFTRAWEFGIGGLLAFAPTARRLWVSLAGLALIAASLALYSGATVFPGAAALLPVVGTLAVIWAGEFRMYRLRPAQWLGDISYSFYLWHWAPILIVPYVLGHDLTDGERVGVLVGALLAAALTKRFVEDRLRAPSGMSASSAVRSVVVTFVVTAVVIAGCGTAYLRTGEGVASVGGEITRAIDDGDACIGAAAMIDDCAQPYAVSALTSPGFAATDIGEGVTEEDACKQTIEGAALETCEFGDTTDYSRTIALVGDSHAAHFLQGLDDYASRHGIRIVTMLKTWCNSSGVAGITSPHGDEASIASCAEWGRAAIDEVIADDDINAMVFSTYSARYSTDFDGRVGRLLTAKDYLKSFARVGDAGKPVVVIRSTPDPDKNIPDCISRHLDEYDPCVQKRSEVVLDTADDTVVTAAKRLDLPVIDVTRFFCDDTSCHWVIGGLIAYFDNSHMTSTFSRTLGPYLGREVVEALR